MGRRSMRAGWFSARRGSEEAPAIRIVQRVRRLLLALDAATKPEDMNLPGFRFHGLNTKPKRYAVDASGNYRVTWAWDDCDTVHNLGRRLCTLCLAWNTENDLTDS